MFYTADSFVHVMNNQSELLLLLVISNFQPQIQDFKEQKEREWQISVEQERIRLAELSERMAQQAVLDQQRYKNIIHTCDFSSGCNLEIDPHLKQINHFGFEGKISWRAVTIATWGKPKSKGSGRRTRNGETETAGQTQTTGT